MFESLKKAFTSVKLDRDTSVSSDKNNVDMVLGGDTLAYPAHHNVRTSSNVKTKKQNAELMEDNLIKTYKQISVYPEISAAVDEIVNECISVNEGVQSPLLTFKKDSEIAEVTQKKIVTEWKEVMNLLEFEWKGDDLFRKWFEESKLIAEVVYKDKSTTKGIQKILILKPQGFRKHFDDNDIPFYRYDNEGFTRHFYFKNDEEVYKQDQIVYSDSGLQKEDETKIGYMYPAIKTINNMNQIEDSLIIYRQLRASEQRIWNVQVGRMPKSKAETYINSVINQIKTDVVYDHETGEMTGKSATDSIINDFVFPSRGTESTSVDTIGGQTNFVDSLEDHELFLKKTYVALKIPVNRLDVDGSTMDFTSSDILRSENKFFKHTRKLLNKFSSFPLDILRLQLISKKLITEDEWTGIKQSIIIKWKSNNPIIENGKLENMKLRAETLTELKDNEIVGKLISYTTAIEQILDMTSEQLEEERELIEKEKDRFKELYQVEED